MTRMNSPLQSWILAARPKTLIAAVVPVIVTSAYAKFYFAKLALENTLLITNSTQPMDNLLQVQPVQTMTWWIPTLVLLASIFIQIGTNLVNDAVDYEKGADTEKRIGPQRMTQSGVFSAKQVKWMAMGCFFLSALCGLPLVFHGGWPILFLGLVSMIMGYSYTGGPFPLAYLGLGDLFVVVFFGFVAILGLAFLLGLNLGLNLIVLSLQVGLLCTVLIAINNLRDVDTDKLVNKKTLPVRFGKKFGRIEIASLIGTSFLLQLYWLVKGQIWVFALPFIVLPLGVKIIKSVFTNEPSPVFNKFLGQSAGLHLLFGLLQAIGFVIQSI